MGQTTFCNVLHSFLSTAQSNLISVVGPRAELERAELLVERVELNVDGTGTLVDRRRLPMNFAVWKQRRLRHQRHLVTPVSATACGNHSQS